MYNVNETDPLSIKERVITVSAGARLVDPVIPDHGPLLAISISDKRKILFVIIKSADDDSQSREGILNGNFHVNVTFIIYMAT